MTLCTLVLPLAFIEAKDNCRDTRNNDTSPERFSNKTDRSTWVIDRQRQIFQKPPGSVTIFIEVKCLIVHERALSWETS